MNDDLDLLITIATDGPTLKVALKIPGGRGQRFSAAELAERLPPHVASAGSIIAVEGIFEIVSPPKAAAS